MKKCFPGSGKWFILVDIQGASANVWLQYSVLVHLYHGFICLYMHACVCMLTCMCSCHACISVSISLQMCILCVCLCACMSDTRAIYTIGLSDSASRKIVPPGIGYLNHTEVYWIHFMPLASPGVWCWGYPKHKDPGLYSYCSALLEMLPIFRMTEQDSHQICNLGRRNKKRWKTALNPNNAHQTCNHLNAHQ